MLFDELPDLGPITASMNRSYAACPIATSVVGSLKVYDVNECCVCRAKHHFPHVAQAMVDVVIEPSAIAREGEGTSFCGDV